MLNKKQLQAVKKALISPEFFLLQGPPGTGKTTVIAELAFQVTLKGETILIASQTNLAVDNALDRLVNVPHLRPLRIGASHRVTKYGLKFLPENVVNRWIKAIIKATQDKIECQKTSSNQKEKSSEPEFWITLQQKWIEKLSNPTDEDLIQFKTIYTKQANVIGMTCNEAGKTQFWASAFFKPFDIIVIDEVSKATLPELLMPMLLGKKIVLVGDHRQLPPLFKEVTFQEEVEEANIANEDKKGFKKFEDLVTKSLYVTLFNEMSPKLKESLTIQYRMHPEIMKAVNNFYADSPLICGLTNPDEQRKHGISFAGVSENRHLIWVDSSFKNGKIPVYEKQAGTSKLNLFEVDLVIESLLYLEEALLDQGYSEKNKKEIGVISFYGAQLLEIRSRIRSLELEGHFGCMQLRTNTVDRFQGMERPIILLSMVRSKTGRVGDFVKRYQRINVAMSRAQELLIIIGAERTFSRFMVEVNDENSKIIAKPVYNTILKNIKDSKAFITSKAFRM
jgi:superfamily I DNA and/or RNA helicase